MAAIVSDRSGLPETLKLVTTFLGVMAILAGLGYAVARLAGLTSGAGAFVDSCVGAWSPGLAALVTLRLHARLQGWDFGWRRPRRRYSFLAIGIPFLVTPVVYGAMWVSGLAPFAGRSDRPSFIGVPALAFAGSGLGILLGAAGEELGWRGFLVPLLERSCDFPAVIWISWVCWFVYRLPTILPAESHGAPSGLPLVASGAMLLALSIILAWLRLRSRSLWPAILLHAAHSLLTQTILDPLTADNGQTAWITGQFGAGVAAAYLPVAWIFLANGHTAATAGKNHTAPRRNTATTAGGETIIRRTPSGHAAPEPRRGGSAEHADTAETDPSTDHTD